MGMRGRFLMSTIGRCTGRVKKEWKGRCRKVKYTQNRDGINYESCFLGCINHLLLLPIVGISAILKFLLFLLLLLLLYYENMQISTRLLFDYHCYCFIFCFIVYSQNCVDMRYTHMHTHVHKRTNVYMSTLLIYETNALRQ